MKLKYIYKKRINTKQLFELYKSVGWATKQNKLNKEKLISKTYKNSQIVISVWNGKELIGILRALTDKVTNGVIFGLIVRPKYQKHGIGENLIKRCIKKYPKIRWYAGSENSESNKFWREIEFKKDKDLWFYKGKGVI